jgi:hypothetical protein
MAMQNTCVNEVWITHLHGKARRDRTSRCKSAGPALGATRTTNSPANRVALVEPLAGTADANSTPRLPSVSREFEQAIC